MVRNNARKKKVTFSLSGDILEDMKELVQKEDAWSQNRFVEEALQEYINKRRREMLRREYSQASRDPLFLSDIKQVEKDFRRADAEASERIV